VRSRTIPRLALLISLTASMVVAGFGAAPPSYASPKTVVRTVPVDLAPLGGERYGGRALAAAGALRASSPTTTRATRVCSPVWFTALGLTWDQRGGTPIQVDVSTSRDGRSFGRTHALDAESGPDPGTEEFASGSSASELLWTGGGRCARVALELTAGATVSNLRIAFVNSSGTPNGPDGVPATDWKPAPPTRAQAPASQVAEAATREPRFISRQRWGANPHLMQCTPDVAPAVKMAFVHHTAGTNHYPRGKADDIVRAIYAYHTLGRGWCDIAYNFLIDRFGRAYEGRSGGVTVPVVSAATQGFNTGSFSVALMGDFTHHRPSRRMTRTLRRVLAWRLDVAHVPPHGRAVMVSGGGDNTRYRKGKRVNLPVISAHRYTGYTACPGTRVIRKLGNVRDAVSKMGLPKIYRPSVTPDHTVSGRPASPVIRASGSDRLIWSASVQTKAGASVGGFSTEAGDAFRRTWSSGSSPPLPTQPGIYEIVLGGVSRRGERARSATVQFRVFPP
jgi:N-acetylmuramoyl-L-alanine amidase